jgi:hypothetical protein
MGLSRLTYDGRRSPPAASIAEQRVSARWGWVGENSGLFEHPAGCAGPIRDLVQSCVFGDRKLFFNSLLGPFGPTRKT